MKYNTYDVINGGPRLVEIAKHRKNKALHFRRKEVLAVFFFKSIKKAQGAFCRFSLFHVFLSTVALRRVKGLPDTLRTKRIS